MHLYLPILLIPMVLASHCLCAMHMHIGAHSADLGSHAGVPHFHAEVGDIHSHHHRGLKSNGHERSGISQPGIEVSPDQHEGAYYVSDSVSRVTNRHTHNRLAELLLISSVGHELLTLSLSSFSKPNADGLLFFRVSGIARVPLFLRDASIRC